MPREASNLNPEIKTISVGVRKLREVKVYPLSVGDQFKLSDVITSAMQGFVSATDGAEDIAVIAVIVEMIKQNLDKVLTLVIEEKDLGEDSAQGFISDITNSQLADIATIIYEVNYAPLQKKIRGILEKIGLVAEQDQRSQLKSLSPVSLDDIPDTDSEISMDEASETEA